MKTMPSGRAVAIALVVGLTIAILAPPHAVLAILSVTALVVWLAHRDGNRARDSFVMERDAPARIDQGEWATVAWTFRAGDAGVRALVFVEPLPPAVDGRDLEVRTILAPGGMERREGAVRPRRRGVLRLGPAEARVLGPRGLGWRRVTLTDSQEIRVDPPIDSLRTLSADTRRTRGVGGAARRLRGVGSEFESLRDYRPDDDSRWIDWKASARRRKLTSREYQVDEHRTVVFLMDTGRMMASDDGERSKLDHALGAALAIGFAAMRRGDNVGLLAFDRRITAELKPGRGRAQSVRMHETLAHLQPSLVEPDYAAAFAHLQHRVRKRVLVLVFTDLVDERVSQALMRAAARASRRHVVVVVTLTDRELLDRLARAPETTLDAYENAVAADAILLRDAVVSGLRASGVRVVDAPADRLAASAVESYLRVRAENRL
jgi:uncharacterized protein (DUF58 family)